MNLKWYGMDGQSMDLLEWGKLYSDARNRRIAWTIRGPWKVSTVLIGMDHSFEEGVKPVIFETMIFHYRTGGQDWFCKRYSSKEEAAEGHRKALASLRSWKWVWRGLELGLLGKRARWSWR